MISPLFYFASVLLALVAGYLWCWQNLKEEKRKFYKNAHINTETALTCYVIGNHQARLSSLLTDKLSKKTGIELVEFLQDNLWTATKKYGEAIQSAVLKPIHIMDVICWAYLLYAKENYSTVNVNFNFVTKEIENERTNQSNA